MKNNFFNILDVKAPQFLSDETGDFMLILLQYSAGLAINANQMISYPPVSGLFNLHFQDSSGLSSFFLSLFFLFLPVISSFS